MLLVICYSLLINFHGSWSASVLELEINRFNFIKNTKVVRRWWNAVVEAKLSLSMESKSQELASFTQKGDDRNTE